MTCYQSTNLPSGVTTTGRTSYKTEADCLQACKEGACCEGTTCTVKPACQCQGTGKTFKGVGTVCTANPCDTTCKPCDAGTTASKDTVTAIVDSVTAANNSPLTTAQLKEFLEGTYTLYKQTDAGLNNLILYTFGGWPVQTGARYADMLYACLQDGVYGNAYYSTGSSFSVTYSVPGLKLVLAGYGAQSTSRGNVCTGAQQQAVANITSPNDNVIYGTGRITVS